MKVIRPNEPEFNYHELFPGQWQIPPANGAITGDSVRTTLNLYRDNFERQKRFSRDLRTDVDAANKRADRFANWLVAFAAGLVIVLVVAIWR